MGSVNYKFFALFIITNYLLIKYLNEKSKILRSKILKVTHAEISNDLGTARPVISRLLKDLEKEGKIKLKRGVIVISKTHFL